MCERDASLSCATTSPRTPSVIALDGSLRARWARVATCGYEPGGRIVARFDRAGKRWPAGPWPKSHRMFPVIFCSAIADAGQPPVAGHTPMASIQLLLPVSSTPEPVPGAV